MVAFVTGSSPAVLRPPEGEVKILPIGDYQPMPMPDPGGAPPLTIGEAKPAPIRGAGPISTAPGAPGQELSSVHILQGEALELAATALVTGAGGENVFILDAAGEGVDLSYLGLSFSSGALMGFSSYKPMPMPDPGVPAAVEEGSVQIAVGGPISVDLWSLWAAF